MDVVGWSVVDEDFVVSEGGVVGVLSELSSDESDGDDDDNGVSFEEGELLDDEGLFDCAFT